MIKQKYLKIDFENFPSILGNAINIPDQTIFYKAYNKNYNPLTNRPSFFGTFQSSSEYLLLQNRELGKFKTIKPIKLLDIRYVKHIINEIIINRKNNDDDIIFGYKTLALSFGLCTLFQQIILYKERYIKSIKNDDKYKKIIDFYEQNTKDKKKSLFLNPIELNGIRIGETNNDIESLYILKQIFENNFDGIISPNIGSPYFDNYYIPNEIIIFNPKKLLKKIKNNISSQLFETKTIIDILHENHIFPISEQIFIGRNNLLYYHIGGNKNENNYEDLHFEKNNFLDEIYNIKNDSNIKLCKKIKYSIKCGNKIKNILYDNPTIPPNQIIQINQIIPIIQINKVNKEDKDSMFNRNNRIDQIYNDKKLRKYLKNDKLFWKKVKENWTQ